MGHGLLLERKHVARGLPFPESLPEPGRYSVLAPLSEGYPHLQGRFPCITHPFATLPGDCSPFTLDLHVLSTPPAFVLSQDQTLQFHLIGSGPRSALLLFSCQRSPLPTRPSFSTRFRANLLILPKRPFPVKPPPPLPFRFASGFRSTRVHFIRLPPKFVNIPSHPPGSRQSQDSRKAPTRERWEKRRSTKRIF